MGKILIADDSSLIRMKCSKLLSDNGYQVVEASSGTEAVDKYREFKPDGVLLDITMPEMDGITALQEIKKIDPVARVAMLTAMGQMTIVKNALEKGARDFIVKPFREGRVLDTVQRLLGNSNLDPF
jgi:two-component system chemotaxis response regulator CheY